MFDTDSFNVTVPLDIVKSNPDSPEMRIAGYGSTSSPDRDDDEIIQKGLDISDFVNFGFFNLDHDNTYILGYPDKEKTRIDKKGFWIEGILLKDVPEARRFYTTALALKKANAPRKLGFSVEGKTLARDALGRITKAKIYNVAITANPVNPEATWDVLVKSFTDNKPISKAMEAGHGFSIDAPSNGSVLIPESLESDLRNLSYIINNPEALAAFKDKMNEHEISDEELILYYQITRGLSKVDAEALVNKIKEGGK